MKRFSFRAFGFPRFPWLERWLNLPRYYHWGVLVGLISAVNFSFVFESLSLHQQNEAMTQDITQQTDELSHQEKLLTALKQQSDMHGLSPQLAKQIVPLDNQLHELLVDAIKQIEYRWDFSSRPVLQMVLEGRFQDLHAFLTALLAQFPHLALAQLNMEKQENGLVQCHLILQLTQSEGTP